MAIARATRVLARSFVGTPARIPLVVVDRSPRPSHGTTIHAKAVEDLPSKSYQSSSGCDLRRSERVRVDEKGSNAAFRTRVASGLSDPSFLSQFLDRPSVFIEKRHPVGKAPDPFPTVPDLFPIDPKLERKDQTAETEGRTRKPRRRNRGRNARGAVDDGERDAERVAMDEEPDPAAAARDRGGWWRAGASTSEARKAGRAHGRWNRKGRRS